MDYAQEMETLRLQVAQARRLDADLTRATLTLDVDADGSRWLADVLDENSKSVAWSTGPTPEEAIGRLRMEANAMTVGAQRAVVR